MHQKQNEILTLLPLSLSYKQGRSDDNVKCFQMLLNMLQMLSNVVTSKAGLMMMSHPRTATPHPGGPPTALLPCDDDDDDDDDNDDYDHDHDLDGDGDDDRPRSPKTMVSDLYFTMSYLPNW